MKKEVLRAWAILLPGKKSVVCINREGASLLPVFATFYTASLYRRTYNIKGARIRRVTIRTEGE